MGQAVRLFPRQPLPRERDCHYERHSGADDGGGQPHGRNDPPVPLEYYYDLADYTDFNKAYPERMRVFRDFLQRNGLAEAAGG